MDTSNATAGPPSLPAFLVPFLHIGPGKKERVLIASMEARPFTVCGRPGGNLMEHVAWLDAGQRTFEMLSRIFHEPVAP